jgi:HlyD family secretion protein
VLLAAAGVGLYTYYAQQNAAQPPAPSIRTATIDRGTLTLIVSATGKIAPAKTVNVSFDAPGMIQEVLVQEGQTVQAGQVLARQDSAAQQLALQQAQANLKVAQLALERLLSAVDPRDIQIAEAQVKAAEGAYRALFAAITPQTIQAAAAQYEQAWGAYQSAIQRRKDVGGQSGPDSIAYQLALAQEGQASFQAEIARLQLEILKRGPDSRAVAAARAQVDASKARLQALQAGPVPAQTDQAQLAIEQARLTVAQAERQARSTELLAPFSGVVSAVNVRVGALAVNNFPAVVMIDPAQLHVDIKVDEIDIGQVREGQPVAFVLDALPDVTLSGKVQRIALIATQTANVTNFDVRVTLDPTAAPVKVGMTASAAIKIRELVDVVRVPNAFVRLDRRTNIAYVNLVNADLSLTEIPVTLGLRTDEYSEVIAGLREGDVVGISLDSNFSLF